MNSLKAVKIFFIGVTEFSLVCFNTLMEMNCNIIGCAYTSENIAIRRQKTGIKNITFIDFAEIANNSNIYAVEFDKAKAEEFEQKVVGLKPDLIIVAGWHYLLGEKLLQLPELGTVGLHSSLLPKYRGSSPLTWQLINGEKASGLTMFYIEEGTDTGDIIGQEAFDINDEDTIKDLLLKSQKAAVNLLKHYVPMIALGNAPRTKQKNEDATYFRMRIPSDGEINWEDTPQNIKNFIRAQTRPYPGAFTQINGKKIIIWDADIIEKEE